MARVRDDVLADQTHTAEAMSISQRKFRATLYNAVAGGSGGRPVPSFQVASSPASDGKWWCAAMNPTGKEDTTNMKEGHTLDAVFVFGNAAPVSETGAIELDGTHYFVRWIGPRNYGHDEQEVWAQRARTPINVVP